jgi:hypothetical protein
MAFDATSEIKCWARVNSFCFLKFLIIGPYPSPKFAAFHLGAISPLYFFFIP